MGISLTRLPPSDVVCIVDDPNNIITLRNPCGSVLFLVDVSVCRSVCPDFSVLSSVRIAA